MFSLFSKRRSGPGLVGIELRRDGVSIVHVVREAGRPPRVTACEFRVWGDDEAKAFAAIAAAHNLKRQRCSTVLDPEEYSLLLTEAPDVPPDELRSAMRWRIKDLIDFHVDDATIDVFDVTTPNAPSKTRPMYVVAARNAAIQRRVNMCDAAGVNLDVIDIPELAQRNLTSILPEDARGVVMLTLSKQRGLITITRQGELFLSRRLEIGTETVLAAGDRFPYFDQIVLEIQRSLDYFDSHFRQAQIDHFVFSPSVNAVPELFEHLRQNLNNKGKILDLASVLHFDPQCEEVLSEHGLIALGAALRHEEKAL